MHEKKVILKQGSVNNRFDSRFIVNNLSFIKRKNINFLLINIFFLTIIFCITYFLSILIDRKYSNIMATLFCIFCSYFLVVIINLCQIYKFHRKTIICEFQNLLFANGIKKISDSFFFINKVGDIIYADINFIELYQDNKNIFSILKVQKNKDELSYALENDLKCKIEEYGILYFYPLNRPYGIFVGSYNENFDDELHNTYINFLKKSKIIILSGYKNPNNFFIITKTIFCQEKFFLNNKIISILDRKKLIIYDKDSNESDVNNSNKNRAIMLAEYEIINTNKSEITIAIHKIALSNMFFYTAPFAIVICNIMGDIVDFNKTFKNVFFKDSEENIKNMEQILLNNSEKFWYCVRHNYTTINNIKLINNDKSSPKIHIRKYDNVLICYIIENEEIDNLRYQLAHSQKISYIGQLAGGIAHDFNNILTGILGFCDIVLDTKNKKNCLPEIVQIKNNAERGRDLINQIMLFARKQPIKTDVYNVNKVIFDLVKFLKSIIGENIDLTIDCGENIGNIEIDKCYFENILTNLIVNAKDATSGKDNAKIIIKTYPSIGKNNKEIVAIDVIDNGCGIKKEHINHIFTPFFSTKDVNKGTGLGLATVYGVVTNMFGSIKVKSQIDIGTTFTILFPVTYKDILAIKKDDNIDIISNNDIDIKENHALLSTYKILVVEDDLTIMSLLEKIFKKNGFSVVFSDDGIKAIEIAKDEKIDLIITDVIMPNIDGVKMVKEIIKYYNSNIKIIFMSGYTKDYFEKYNMNFDYTYLQKPFSIKQIISLVYTMLPIENT